MSPLMRRRPVLRAAAVGGGAYAMGKRRAGSAQAAEPAAASEPGIDPMERLKQLGQLHDSGVLTDEEFAQQKAKLLG